MLRKLSFILIIAILLSGCGASAPSEAEQYGAAESIFHRAEQESTAKDTFLDTETLAESPAEAGEGAVCKAEYFLFGRDTNAITDDSGQTILYENFTGAEFTSDDPERCGWVNGILGGIARDYATNSTNLREYAGEFIDMNGSEHFYSYSNYQQLGVARHDEAVVSLIELSSLYSGGTHPNSVQIAYNLDIENRRLLRLEDVIAEEAAQTLAELVRRGVDGKFTFIDGGNGLFEDYGATIDNSMVYGAMTPYWYLNDKGLVIFYNQYELGPYAAGIIKVEVPYEDLKGILNEEYFPPYSGGSGGLRLMEDFEGLHGIPVTIEAAGQTLLVGVEGTVYQVQLSEILWLEDTPIAQELIFSAKSLCQNDVLEITGGFDDETRSFAIEFINGRGEQKIYYIHVGELTENP